MLGVAVQVGVGTVLMLLGILSAVRFRGISLGGFWNAGLRLAAISVSTSAVATLCQPAFSHMPLGFLLAAIVEFVVYFTLLGLLFDLGESDTWYCVWVIFLVRLGVYFFLRGALSTWAR